MGELKTILASVLLTLITIDTVVIIVLILRQRREHIKYLLLAGILVLLGLRSFFAPAGFVWLLLSLVLCILAGNYAYLIYKSHLPFFWNATVVGLTIPVIIASLLGRYRDGWALWFLHFIVGGSLGFPVLFFILSYLLTREKVFFLFLSCLILASLCGLADFIWISSGQESVNCSLGAALIVSLAGGFLLFRDLLRKERALNLTGCAKGGEGKAVPRALVIKDRLISSGYTAASTIHEFKNILFNIGLCTDIALKKRAHRMRSLKLIKENVDLAMRTVINLLENLALVGREPVARVRMDLLVQRVSRKLQNSFKNQHIQFLCRVEEGLIYRTRRLEMEQVIINLLRNSVLAFQKHKTDPGRIMIRLFRKYNLIFLELEDNAGGIPYQYHPLLFKPPSAAKPSGLGLYLSQRLVRANNGYIEFLPTSGGSLFRLVLTQKK